MNYSSLVKTRIPKCLCNQWFRRKIFVRLLTVRETSYQFPIWRLIPFSGEPITRIALEKAWNWGSTCRCADKVHCTCSRLVEGNNGRLELILIGWASRVENHECSAGPVLFLAAEIDTFLCLGRLLRLAVSSRYLVSRIALLSLLTTRLAVRWLDCRWE